MSDAKRDARALQLFTGAVPLEKIRDQLGYRSVTSAQAAVNRALDRRARQSVKSESAEVELERLDAIYATVYPRAIKGDLAAVDRALRIGETRLRLAADRATTGRLVEAYEAAVDAIPGIDAEGVDQAVIEAGRVIARQIDYATTYETGQNVTKALYLIPHLMNVLRELNATPAARSAVRATVPDQGTQNAAISSLEAFRAAAMGK